MEQLEKVLQMSGETSVFQENLLAPKRNISNLIFFTDSAKIRV